MRTVFVVNLILFLSPILGGQRCLAQQPEGLDSQRITLPTVTAQRFGDGAGEYWVFLPAEP